MTPGPTHKFILYVAEDTINSAQARVNLSKLCDKHLPGRHHIEIINVFKDPQRALVDHIFMTPVLVRLAPTPVRRIMGTLSQTDKVLAALGLEDSPA